jgi:excisionase family DNA binding protein
MPKPLTAVQVADQLGISKSRVIALIRAGRLPAQKIGVQWLINRADLHKVRVRKPGRPKKKRDN